MKAGIRMWQSGLVAMLLFVSSQNHAGTEADVTVHGDRPGPIIHREIYGQFAEMLGRGIYGGIWVGENSSLPVAITPDGILDWRMWLLLVAAWLAAGVVAMITARITVSRQLARMP